MIKIFILFEARSHLNIFIARKPTIADTIIPTKTQKIFRSPTPPSEQRASLVSRIAAATIAGVPRRNE